MNEAATLSPSFSRRACSPRTPRRASSPAKWLAPWAILAALCGLLFFHHLAARDLWSSHEARAAQDAQTILDDGGWGLPRLFDGEVELQKPPLYYWGVAALAWCRGGAVDAWAVRLPAALSALGCVLALYGFGRRCGRPVAGVVAAAALATALHFTWLARVGRIDMPLTLTVGLAVGGVHLARREPNAAAGWLLVAYLAVATGLLLKGPIAAVLPAAALGTHLLAEGELPPPWHVRRWLGLGRRVGVWWGLPLVAGLALPWFVWANARTHGELFRVFFWHHNVERGFDDTGELWHHNHPWWFYGPRLAFDFLPWSPLLPVAGWFLLRRGRWRADLEARLGLAWLLAILVLLSCFHFKRADYLLPAFPGAALVLGCAAERWYEAGRLRRLLAAGFALAVAGCAAGWWVYVERVLPRDETKLEQRRFAAEIRRRAPAPRPVLFFWTENHALAFHVGRPLHTLIEWQDLDAWAARPESTYVVMPPEVAAEWPQHLRDGRLEEVLRSTDLAGTGQKRPLVLLRTLPPTEPSHARSPGPAADRDRAAECPPAGPQRGAAPGGSAGELGQRAHAAGARLRNPGGG
jgi:4-amino-4-deoxy-L-arabinose transferase-like glycosyltransferase